MKDKFLELASHLSELPRKVLDQNMFVLLGKAKELEAESSEIKNLVTLEFPDLIDNRAEKDKILALTSYNEAFWTVISTLMENLFSLLKGRIDEESLQNIEDKLLLLKKLLVKRSEITKISDLIQLLKDSIATRFDIQLLIEPYNIVYSTINEIIKECQGEGRVIISKKELLKELFSRVKYSLDTEKIEMLLENEFEENQKITLNREEYLFVTPYRIIINDLLHEIPKDSSGITYLELLKRTGIPKDLFDVILEDLEKEGRLIKEDTAKSGEILYFPELY